MAESYLPSRNFPQPMNQAPSVPSGGGFASGGGEGFFQSDLGKFTMNQAGKAVPFLASAVASNLFKSKKTRLEEEESAINNQLKSQQAALFGPRMSMAKSMVGRLPDHMQGDMNLQIDNAMAAEAIKRSQEADKKKKGGFWKKLGKIALMAAPIIAAPFTGGASLAAIGALSGAASGALSGGGLKGALLGGALGAIPMGGGLAKGAVAPTLAAGLKQAGKSIVTNPMTAGRVISGVMN
jgi:hypothetical protein